MDQEFPNPPYDLNSDDIKGMAMEKYYHCLVTMDYHIREAFAAYTLMMPYVHIYLIKFSNVKNFFNSLVNYPSFHTFFYFVKFAVLNVFYCSVLNDLQQQMVKDQAGNLESELGHGAKQVITDILSKDKKEKTKNERYF